MNPHAQMLLTAVIALVAGAGACWFFTMPGRKRVLEEAAKPDPRYFTEAEQDAWIEYEMACDAARDVYNERVARLKELHANDLLDRAKIRFLRRKESEARHPPLKINER